VTVLERERFPRYHIGESLLASVISTLRLSGAYDQVVAHGFQEKWGGFFQWKNDTWRLNWADLIDANASSFQVDRAEFDNILLRNASAQGAKVIELATVQNILFAADGERPTSVEWTGPDGRTQTTTFDFLVDASGRAGLLASRRYFDLRRPNPQFRNMATWSYWEGAHLHPDSPTGAINVVSTDENGWFWHIPLAGGRFSTGYVVNARLAAAGRRELGSLDAYYHDAIRRTPAMGELLAGARQIDAVRAEADYSYTADRVSGPGYVIVGDAAYFLDPLLSTGVHLATVGGLVAAAAIATTLRGQMPEKEALDFFDYTYQRSYARFLVLVTRMYDQYVGAGEYFAHSRPLTEAPETDSDQLHFTRIMAGLTDPAELAGQQRRIDTATIADATGHLDGVNDKYMGGISMRPVWDHWRDPLGADTEMGELRITTDPVLGLTRRPRTDSEIAAVVLPFHPPKGAATDTH
jgi:flavin-dependent dehydrogenase